MAFFTAKAKPLFIVTSGIDRDTIHELYELHMFLHWCHRSFCGEFHGIHNLFTDVLVSSKVLQVTPHIHELIHCVGIQTHWLSSA